MHKRRWEGFGAVSWVCGLLAGSMVHEVTGFWHGDRGFCLQLSARCVPVAGIFIRKGECYSAMLSKIASMAKVLLEKIMTLECVLTCGTLRAADPAERDDVWSLFYIRSERIFTNVLSITVITPVAQNVRISILPNAEYQCLWFVAELLFSIRKIFSIYLGRQKLS